MEEARPCPQGLAVQRRTGTPWQHPETKGSPCLMRDEGRSLWDSRGEWVFSRAAMDAETV